MKNIFRMAMVAFAAIALSACEPSGGEQGGRGLILDVKVENITATSATVKVSHNGKAADSWYGLLTTNTSTREDMLIEETVNALKSGDLASQLIFSKNYSKILSSLQPNTTYKYIAFGLTEDGVIYGESASVEFTTQSGNGGGNQGGDQGGNEEVYDNMIVNPNWSVAYTGAGVIGEKSYNHTVTVNSADNNYYTIAVVSASDFSAENLRVSTEQLAADMVEFVKQYNQAHDPDITRADMLFQGNGKEAFEDLDYYPGYYKAVAIGITSQGVVSGLYAVSPTVEIKEEAQTTLYSSWLGSWVLRGDNNISNNITISNVVSNKVVALTGLMELDLPIFGEYSVERNDIIFSAQTVKENVTFDNGSVGTIYLVGLDNEGHFYSLDKGEYAIVIAGVMESEATGTQRALVRYGVNDPNYPKFVAMMFVAYIDGEYWSLDIYDENDPYATTIPSFNVMAEINAPAATLAHSPKLLFGGKGAMLKAQPIFKLGNRVYAKSFE